MKSTMVHRYFIGFCGMTALALALGCKSEPSKGSSSESPSSSAKAKAPTPVPPEKVAEVVNPKKEAPYSGPTGTLTGTIRIKGDAAPMDSATFPPECDEAAAMYAPLFRTGKDQALADVLVAVTGYEGYVPAKEEAVKLTLRGCAISQRTVVATFGQRIEVANIDKTATYMPYLDGAPFRVVMVAIPGGDPVKMYPQEPGHYMIRDQMGKLFMTSDVYALKYATHAVTGLDGRYEIAGIPVGKVKVNAFLPAADLTSDQEIEIKAGENNADITLEFDLKKYEERRANAAKKITPKPLPSGEIGPKG